MLAEYGPTAVAPSRFIRFIFNRIILEGASVRAAAVQSLGEFAGRVESVRESVQELLRGCLTDESDEVRDRAVTALAALQQILLSERNFFSAIFPCLQSNYVLHFRPIRCDLLKAV